MQFLNSHFETILVCASHTVFIYHIYLYSSCFTLQFVDHTYIPSKWPHCAACRIAFNMNLTTIHHKIRHYKFCFVLLSVQLSCLNICLISYSIYRNSVPKLQNNVKTSSVGITTSYVLDLLGSILGRSKSGFGANPVSYQMGTKGDFPEDKAARVWSRALTSICCWGQEWWSYTSTPPSIFMAWCSRNNYTFILRTIKPLFWMWFAYC
jgi:hypothetical protein